jgi:hypothetical protein
MRVYKFKWNHQEIEKKHLFWRVFIWCFEYCSSRLNICIYFHVNINKFIDVSRCSNADVSNSNLFIVSISKFEDKTSNVFSWVKFQSAKKLQKYDKKVSTTRKTNIKNHSKNDQDRWDYKSICKNVYFFENDVVFY